MWTQQHCLGHRPKADTCRTRKVSAPFRGLSWLLGSLQPGGLLPATSSSTLALPGWDQL